MQTLPMFASVLLVASPAPDRAMADAIAEIKALVPKASAMRKADFDRLATSPTSPKSSDFKDKSLTLMLFALRPKDDEQARKEFRFLGQRPPKAAAVGKEMYRTLGMGRLRVLAAPITMIHANRITDVTCKIEGEVARGTISFHVPKLYEGRVDYVARRAGGKWRIEELLMPAYGIHIVRTKDNLWQEKAPTRRG